MKIEHIGIAVTSIEKRLSVWKDLLDLEMLYIKEVPDQNVKVAVLECGGLHIELLEALNDRSPIHSFIETRGEGIHHLCFKVDDVEAALAKMTAQHVRLIDEKPRIGASGKKIAFIHPHDMGGVLLELSE